MSKATVFGYCQKRTLARESNHERFRVSLAVHLVLLVLLFPLVW